MNYNAFVAKNRKRDNKMRKGKMVVDGASIKRIQLALANRAKRLDNSRAA